MGKVIQAVRGMNDLLPEEVGLWQCVEDVSRSILATYGYREIRLPVVERTELFARSIGQFTDIVEKEMYTFEDRNGDSLTLRPEATAGCVRAGIQNGLLYNQIQRLWYAGPMFRHERPQRGRYRQFHQIGVEAFGMPGPDIDAELITISARLWRELGVEGLNLQINSLGMPESRAAYREHLQRYLEDRYGELDEDSRRRLQRNPLRILDSKNPAMQSLLAAAPRLCDHLDEDSLRHFEGLQGYLGRLGIRYVVNPMLVRGLDYYNRTVFEWVTDRLGAQGTVCAGGRFDGLVEQLGGHATAAAGFSLGMERLVELMALQDIRGKDNRPQIYVAMIGEAVKMPGMGLCEDLRRGSLRVQCNCGGGSLKAQMKRADRSGATLAVILGENEIENGTATVKNLRSDGAQKTVPVAELLKHLRQRLQA